MFEKLWPIPREIVVAVNLSLLVVVAIWGVQLWQYNNHLAEMREESIEKCFYYECDVAGLSNQLTCDKKQFDTSPSFSLNATRNVTLR